uniref:Myb-like domain-containing protein n=1 Tax=Bionectria ochroleuca TaxID=29856 RepID=A0A8H7TRM1_BIOOC
MTNEMLTSGDDDLTLAVPTTMIWVCGRWTLIFHTDMGSHDPVEVRTSFLDVLHLLDFNIFYPNCHNFPLFSLEQDGTFQPIITVYVLPLLIHYPLSMIIANLCIFALLKDFQYIAPNHLLIQVPGREHSWFIEIPLSPLRPLTSSYLSILNASVPDYNNSSVGLSNLLDPRLLEGTQGQLALPQADVSNASSACFQPWGAAQESQDSMTEHDKLGLNPFGPAYSLMGQKYIEFPQCPPSSPVRHGSPETIHSTSPPSDASIEQSIGKLRRRRACSSVVSRRAGHLRPSRAAKKRTMPSPPPRGHFKVSRQDRFMVPYDSDLRDELLIRGRLMGFSYSEIKESAGMPDALATLRGRYQFLLRKMVQEDLKKRDDEKDSDGKNKE